MKLLFVPFTLFVFLFGCRKTLTETSPADAASIHTNALSEVSAAGFKVASALGDNMVLQRDKPVAIWGSAIAGHTITLTASWLTNPITVNVSKTNNWLISLPPSAANNQPQRVTISDNGTVAATFKNILLGDVWICSGQSNMEMPVDSTSPWPGYEGVDNFKGEIAVANWPELRLIQIKKDFSPALASDLSSPASWSVCNPNTVKAYSAVAYFFGRKLLTSLNVPVGLVVSSVGGTYCEAWTQKEALQADPVLDAYYSGRNRSSKLFNGMIYPLKYMAVKGFIWYQGESNRHDEPPANYTRLNSAMIKNWRSTFRQGDLPFYFVQMTPYNEDLFSGGKPVDNDYAFFREAQANITGVTGSTGMAITMDVGEASRIHPRNKKPVGERLALLALRQTYGMSVQSQGPQYTSFTADQRKVSITYKTGTANGLTTAGNAPLAQYFFVAGTDKVFRQAKAVISGDKVMLTANAQTPLPVQAVRYAFTNYPVTNLQNNDGLPAEPFRTDNWTDVITTP